MGAAAAAALALAASAYVFKKARQGRLHPALTAAKCLNLTLVPPNCPTRPPHHARALSRRSSSPLSWPGLCRARVNTALMALIRRASARALPRALRGQDRRGAFDRTLEPNSDPNPNPKPKPEARTRTRTRARARTRTLTLNPTSNPSPDPGAFDKTGTLTTDKLVPVSVINPARPPPARAPTRRREALPSAWGGGGGARRLAYPTLPLTLTLTLT